MLNGVAAEFERDLPFSVWTDALDAYVASQALDLEALGPLDVVLELGEILPSLRPSGVGRGESVADERYRSHRAIRTLLALLAADRPLVLVLDDLHWSDAASIELIGGAAAARSRARRSSSRSPSGRARRPAGCRPRSRCRRSAASRSASSARRRRASCWAISNRRAVAAIYRHGGGNPFYLEQLARAGEEAWRHRAPDGNGAGNGVPAAVAASLAEELASLSGKQRALLDAAAVAGEPFEAGLAAAIAELSAADGLAALDGLLALDLVRPTPVPRRFIFRHPLVRRAVLESAPGGWKLAAHARAAAALAARRRRSGRVRAPRRALREPGRRAGDRAAPARRARRRRRALRPSLPTGSKRRCGCCRPRTASGRWTFGSTSPGRCARSASSSAAGRRCWMRWRCFPPTRWRAGSS